MADVDDDEPANDLTALRECLKSLQEHAARVVRLRYEQQKSCGDIAELQQRSLTWVTSTLSRARQALRRCIDSRLSEETAT